MEESGILCGLSQQLVWRKRSFGWRQGAILFFGETDYDGYTWTQIPIRTDVTYMGGAVFFDLEPIHEWPSGFAIKGFTGVGGRLWLRDLEGTQTPSGTRVAGVEEWWWTLYGRIGLGMAYAFRQFGQISMEAGMKLPIDAKNHATFFISGSSSVDLEPEQRISPFINAQWAWKKIRIRMFYDTLRFDASDRVKSGTFELFQPESDADMIGAELSVVVPVFQ